MPLQSRVVRRGMHRTTQCVRGYCWLFEIEPNDSPIVRYAKRELEKGYRNIQTWKISYTEPENFISVPARRLFRVSMVVIAVIVVIGLLILLPGPIARWASPDADLSGKDRADALTSTRQILLAAVGGIAVLGGLGFTARSFYLTRRGQFTERFGKAITLLASDVVTERLAGIYSLEHLMRESERDHGPVVEVLAAYIRQRSPVKPVVDAAPGDVTQPVYLPVPEVDIQAALTVLARRPMRPSRNPIDLSGTDLRGVDLGRANLNHVLLDGVQLDGALMYDCQLSNASLTGASMRDAYLAFANLGNANLWSTDLSFASLYNADLTGARLFHTNLNGAQLSDPYNEKRDAKGLSILYFGDVLITKTTTLPRDARWGPVYNRWCDRPAGWLPPPAGPPSSPV